MTSEKDRKHWMSVLAKTPAATVKAACADIDLPTDIAELRAPEIGGVMARGRMGASGNAFNLGEISVTRAAVQLADGTVGHAYVQGRDRDHAKTAAILDALLQTNRRGEIESAVIQPLERLIADRHAGLKTKAEATRVDFFTMVRGD
ncbi:MAG: phosphonate C-P lyase system protein PhnG [Pseudomonadota bacterium]